MLFRFCIARADLTKILRLYLWQYLFRFWLIFWINASLDKCVKIGSNIGLKIATQTDFSHKKTGAKRIKNMLIDVCLHCLIFSHRGSDIWRNFWHSFCHFWSHILGRFSWGVFSGVFFLDKFSCTFLGSFWSDIWRDLW